MARQRGTVMPPDDRIQHVVLLMMENHSFDQMLGCLQDVYADLDGVDTSATVPRSNPNLAGEPVYQIPTDEQQVLRDPIHETPNVLVQLAEGNTGFVKDYQRNVPLTTAEDRQNVMGYYVLDRLPALHQLGRDFTVCDRWFSSLPGPTWPNRFFALSGTSSGRVKMPSGLSNPNLDEFNAQTQETIFDRLDHVGKPWKIYYYDFPLSLLFTPPAPGAQPAELLPDQALLRGREGCNNVPRVHVHRAEVHGGGPE